MSDTTRHLDVLIVNQPLTKPEKCDRAKEYACAWENCILEATAVYSFLFCINYRCTFPPSRTHKHTQKSNKMTLFNSSPFSRLAHRPSAHTHTLMNWQCRCSGTLFLAWWVQVGTAVPLHIPQKLKMWTHTLQSQSNDTALGQRCPAPAPHDV